MKNNNLLRRKILFPIVKILLGGIVCILLPIIINKYLLNILFIKIGLSEIFNRGLRVFVTTVILMPVIYYYFFKKIENRPVDEVKFKGSIQQIFFGFVLSVLIIGISFLILLLTGFISVSAYNFPSEYIVNIILILGLVITEEVFFRGIFYRIVENRWGTNVALLSSSLIFAIAHFFNDNTSLTSFLSVIIGGAVLGILYTKSKNIWVPIAFHFGWNLSQALLGFGLSGGDEFQNLYLFEFSLKGSEFITGGISGIENSIIVILMLTVVFIVQYHKIRSKISDN